MSVARCETETEQHVGSRHIASQDLVVPTEVPPRNRDEYLSTKRDQKKSIGDPDSSGSKIELDLQQNYHTFSLHPIQENHYLSLDEKKRLYLNL